MKYNFILDKLLSLLQVQKPDQHPDNAGNQEKDATFDDDAFPDDWQKITGDRERVKEDVPEGPFDKRRICS